MYIYMNYLKREPMVFINVYQHFLGNVCLCVGGMGMTLINVTYWSCLI